MLLQLFLRLEFAISFCQMAGRTAKYTTSPHLFNFSYRRQVATYPKTEAVATVPFRLSVSALGSHTKMPQTNEKLAHGSTHLSGGALTLRLTSPYPRQPQAEAPPERAAGSSGLQVPEERQDVRQLQNHLAYLQRQQGLPSGLTGGWNESAEEKLRSWLLTDVKGMKDRKQQLALEDKPKEKLKMIRRQNLM